MDKVVKCDYPLPLAVNLFHHYFFLFVGEANKCKRCTVSVCLRLVTVLMRFRGSPNLQRQMVTPWHGMDLCHVNMGFTCHVTDEENALYKRSSLFYFIFVTILSPFLPLWNSEAVCVQVVARLSPFQTLTKSRPIYLHHMAARCAYRQSPTP